jgi:hypothetical protein
MIIFKNKIGENTKLTFNELFNTAIHTLIIMNYSNHNKHTISLVPFKGLANIKGWEFRISFVDLIPRTFSNTECQYTSKVEYYL